MLYRQKILLALHQVIGGRLGSTDLEKLLFLYCKYCGEDHYDFFPYKYGPFSLVSYDDRRRLVQSGYLLREDDSTEAPGKARYFESLQVRDRAALSSFTHKYGRIRGRELVRRSYLEYPGYAIKSEIVASVMTPEELESAKTHWQLPDTPTLFTLGYEGISVDAYLDILVRNNVGLLVDVRKNPLSRKYGFSQKALKENVERIGVEYRHLPELGIESVLRKELIDAEDYAQLFEYYANEILPAQVSALDRVKQYAHEYGRIVLTCFEAQAHMCHRHKISDRLSHDDTFGIPVVHL